MVALIARTVIAPLGEEAALFVMWPLLLMKVSHQHRLNASIKYSMVSADKTRHIPLV